MSDTPLKLEFGKSVDLASRRARVDMRKLGKPHFVNVSVGLAVGYQPSRKKNKAGMWHVRWSNGDGTNTRKRLAIADDYAQANGETVLSYSQAFARARDYAKHGGDATKLAGFEPITVVEALYQYKGDLLSRGGAIWNATQPANHLAAYRDATRINLLSKPVQDTTEDDWRRWRDWVRSHRGVTGAAVNRVMRGLKAALNLAARKDHKRITNGNAWRYGLTDLPHTASVNRKPFKQREAVAIIQAAYDQGERFGLWVEANALGVRPSQLAELNVEHFEDDDPTDPFLNVMASRKGKKKERVRTPVSLPLDFARRLRASIAGRARNEPLLLNPKGHRWSAGDDDHINGFRKIMVALGFAKRVEGRTKGREVGRYGPTMYSLRHTAITAQVAANNVDLLSIAKTYDTSAKIINDHYAKQILGETRRKMRAATLDAGPMRKRTGKVVPMKAVAR